MTTRDASARPEMVRGTYFGSVATTLASGRPVAPGDVVEVDSRGDDAHLVSLLGGLVPVERDVVGVKRPRGVKRQENEA